VSYIRSPSFPTQFPFSTAELQNTEKDQTTISMTESIKPGVLAVMTPNELAETSKSPIPQDHVRLAFVRSQTMSGKYTCLAQICTNWPECIYNLQPPTPLSFPRFSILSGTQNDRTLIIWRRAPHCPFPTPILNNKNPGDALHVLEELTIVMSTIHVHKNTTFRGSNVLSVIEMKSPRCHGACQI
jgi:hypothetical protein